MMKLKSDKKFIFITGGVVSSLGKGIASASLGMLLKQRGLGVSILKMDPYINVDPGTMSPLQHGEVFVLDDGSETDLDLGHYERFLNQSLTRDNNTTTGKIYHSVISKERKGNYLGSTVQVIPHITDEIKNAVYKVANQDDVDVVIAEIGGTVGDIEGQPFLEAIRQVRLDMGRNSTVYVHLTLIPYIKAIEEIKTKPTQHSVRGLRDIGIQPDILICRTEKALSKDIRKKIALFCNVDYDAVIEAIDVTSIYNVPLLLHENGLDRKIEALLTLDLPAPDLDSWKRIVHRIDNPSSEVDIALCGKYVGLKDSYKSILESFVHAGIANDVKVNLHWVDSERLTEENIESQLKAMCGILVPGGFGIRGVEGMVVAAAYARRKKVPYFGICLGLQCAVIEFARNACGLSMASSSEFDCDASHQVIGLMKEQEDIVEKGGTMRVGAYPSKLVEGSIARKIYGEELIHERHRHRYEINNKYRKLISENGMLLSGLSPDESLVEMVELPHHPWFLGCQFHPELKSRPMNPHPLFVDFVRAVKEYRALC